ncbi:MAG TPA: rod shape-determining protein RodA [bacterium]|nr:rod shape-determining protein RodA [bacterium]
MSTFKRSVIAALIALMGVGLLAIYSATAADSGTSYLVKQVIWIVVGLGAMFGMSLVRTKTLEAFSPIIYAVVLLMLVLVLVAGSGPHGAKRWFNFGFMRFQPSELAKLGTIFFLARYLSGRTAIGDSIRSVLVAFAIVGVPALLILYEPDLGTALVLGFIAFPMLYAAGLDSLYLAFLVSPFLAMISAGEIVTWVIFLVFLIAVMVRAKFRTSFVVLIFAINFVVGSLAPRIWMGLEPYQRQRIEAFLDPEAYRHGAGFQAIQSKIAIGSGGLIGKGLFKGTQKALGLVPEQHTDFVFSVIGEELGLITCLAVLGLLLYVILKFFDVAKTARDRFTTYVVSGFASLVLVQAIVNIGMNLGMIPVTGLTLPFLSYGGSSIIVLLSGVGIVFSAYGARKGY